MSRKYTKDNPYIFYDEYLGEIPIKKKKITSQDQTTNIKEALQNILEINHQMTGSNSQCPWCQADEFPVDKDGKEITNPSEVPHGYDINHEKNCAVTLIEELLIEQFPKG
jgi:hypothetical protein